MQDNLKLKAAIDAANLSAASAQQDTEKRINTLMAEHAKKQQEHLAALKDLQDSFSVTLAQVIDERDKEHQAHQAAL